MKEIVEILIKKRNEMGMNINEVAVDLDCDPEEIEALEEGNSDYFEDVYRIKSIISEYAKYLGVDQEKILDEYNEFLFDFTSKISIKDIKKQVNKTNQDKKKDNTIKSPYTKKYTKIKRKILLLFLIVAILSIVLALIVF